MKNCSKNSFPNTVECFSADYVKFTVLKKRKISSNTFCISVYLEKTKVKTSTRKNEKLKYYTRKLGRIFVQLVLLRNKHFSQHKNTFCIAQELREGGEN